MGLLETYFESMCRVRASGEATDETSYYAPLASLLNSVGAGLAPSVQCVMTPRNRGAGIPDGGLFVRRPSAWAPDESATESRIPERGVIEVKGLTRDVLVVARTQQVSKYLDRYGQVVVTNYRDFLQVRRTGDDDLVIGERFTLAPDQSSFWRLNVGHDDDLSAEFESFLQRLMLADAPISSPEDVAWFLGAYARIARDRVAGAGELSALRNLRTALEDALGIRFEGTVGAEFFRSTLIQTLFYGLFAAWVDWCGQRTRPTREFAWRTAQWSLNVPMVRVLFEQLTTPRQLPAGLAEVLDWTEELLARVDEDRFFERFENREAIQHFYEPFLQAYDPDLRRLLGVWYTPPEVVHYIVERVHESIQRDLGLPLGLADERVHVLDPCTGTGSFLVETLSKVARVLQEHHGDSLTAEQTRDAALRRIHGFELLPAPFVVAHLQIGMRLAELGAPLDASRSERASVYLTNALTGWDEAAEKMVAVHEFNAERAAAGHVKREQPILVVLGNPPYNGYAGVSGVEESDLLAPYKAGLSAPPWEITKNKLDDYYVRFLRIAERRIAEQTGMGIVAFITNFGWLGDPSAVLMRRHLLREFDRLYIDNLNGDSRETGKKTPEGAPDPSVFSSKLTPAGIQVGTAISLLVRTGERLAQPSVLYRDFWGAEKRNELSASLDESQEEPHYELLAPDDLNWFRLRRWQPRAGYAAWPRIVDLAEARPDLGLNENRGEALVEIERDPLEARLQHFLNPSASYQELDPRLCGGLLDTWADYDAEKTRDRLLASGGFFNDRIRRIQVRPFDVRWCYADATAKLWNRPRPPLLQAAAVGSRFILARRRAPRALDGAAIHTATQIVDQHALHKDAYAIPSLLPKLDVEEGRLFDSDLEARAGVPWRANLSSLSLRYLDDLGYDGVHEDRQTAEILWLHALAIGFAPAYLEENSDATRSDWPRIPLPRSREDLDSSAALGVRLSGLLDGDTPLPGLDFSVIPRLRTVAAIGRRDRSQVTARDLAIRVGWGVVQLRTQKSGAVSRIVMPGDGSTELRTMTDEERANLTPGALEILGEEVVDVYLNHDVAWFGVPLAAWNFKIGGFQVMRKWLSYREESILQRPLTIQEARHFQSMGRRLTELALLQPDLSQSYYRAAGVVQQDPLPILEAVPGTPESAV